MSRSGTAGRKGSPGVSTGDNWQPWQDEIKRYKARETEGLDKDLKALIAHIEKLREICPKDSAGSPTILALLYINKQQRLLDEVKVFLAGVDG